MLSISSYKCCLCSVSIWDNGFQSCIISIHISSLRLLLYTDILKNNGLQSSGLQLIGISNNTQTRPFLTEKKKNNGANIFLFNQKKGSSTVPFVGEIGDMYSLRCSGMRHRKLIPGQEVCCMQLTPTMLKADQV